MGYSKYEVGAKTCCNPCSKKQVSYDAPTSPPPPHNGQLSPTATFFYPQGGHCGKSSTLTAKINVPVGKQKLLVYACNTAAAIFMEHWGWLKYQPSVTVLGIRLKEGERRKKYACLNSHCSVGIMLENGAFDCCGVALYMANRSIPVSFIVSW